MRRSSIRAGLALAAAIFLGGMISSADAQYGGYGWGGWGGASTVGGDVARGMGVFAAGAGQYNVNTAQARSINTQTAMNMNEYMYQSFQIAQQQYYAKTAAKKEQTNMTIQELENRHLYAPNEGDVISGDALNAILNQLHNPNVPNSVMDNLGTDLVLSGDMIKLIPLKFAQKGVIISIDRLAVEDGWPLPLLGADFKNLRTKYESFVKKAKDLPDDQTVADEEIIAAIDLVNQMRQTAQADVQSGKLSGPDYGQAEKFLKGLAGMLQMARQPDIRKVLRQAAQKPQVKISNAVAFMEVFNLQFGVARTPEEKALYTQSLYPMLRDLRDRMEKELGNKIPTATTSLATNFDPKAAANTVGSTFQDVHWNDVSRTAPPQEPPAVEEPGGAK